MSLSDALVLNIQVGSDKDGRSTWCSSPYGELLAKEDAEVFCDYGYFEIRLWLSCASETFKNVLKQLTRSRMSESFADVVAQCNFALVGAYGGSLDDPVKYLPILALK
eukprot:CAMPEP_0169418516 /NCGR_PEP_ID=MMETSP1017-20121227/64367_1 /TAXON_ID=342587 /ORGANISM="Karlodinium micrum, Strain CCMP2283" /LENGTH=107 /DNA_ID=CAMNT_0009526875 /DNA_START=50 /DNA_END=370 /DNA_ORIENTATION=-